MSKDRPARPRRRRWRFVLVLLALIALGWFAPAIIARTPLKNSVIRAALDGYRGDVEVGKASLGWLSPVTVQAIRLTGEQGQPLIAVEKVTTEKRLYQLLVDADSLGGVTLCQPHIRLTVREGGSDLEDALAPLLQAESSGSVGCAVAIENGAIEIRQAGGEGAWSVKEINGTIDIPHRRTDSIEARLSGRPNDSPDTSGVVSIDGMVKLNDSSQIETAQFDVTSSAAPMSLLAPIARRFNISLHAAGQLSGDIGISLSDGGATQKATIANVHWENVELHAPDVLGDEVVRLRHIGAMGEVDFTNGRLTVKGGRLEAPLGHVNVAGSVPLEALQGKNLLAALQSETCAIDGEVDLAQLFHTLPKSLRIREDAEITSGKATIRLASSDVQGRRVWEASVNARGLSAIAAGRQIAWEHPLQSTLRIHVGEDGLSVEDLSCNSEFLTLTGHGSLAAGQAAASGDLSRLGEELRQFFDLGETNLTGRIEATLNWRADQDQIVTAVGRAEVQDFLFALAGRAPISESQLVVDVEAAAKLQGSSVDRIDRAELKLFSGTDQLRVELTEPIDKPTPHAVFPLQATLAGNLTQWRRRLAPIASMPDWRAEGGVNMAARGQLTAGGGVIESSQIRLQDLRVASSSFVVDEPNVEIQLTKSSWDRASGKVTAQDITLASSTASLRIEDVGLSPRTDGLEIVASAGFRVDLKRLTQMAPAVANSSLKLGGVAEGQVDIRQTSQGLQAAWTGDVHDFLYQAAAPRSPKTQTRPVSASRGSGDRHWQTLWAEETLKLDGKATLAADRNSLAVHKLSVVTEPGSLNYQGKVTRLLGHPVLDLTGEVEYDLEKLCQRFRPMLGEDFVAKGRHRRSIQLRGPMPGYAAGASTGPLVSDDFQMTAGVAWDSIQTQGLHIGPAEAKLTVLRGVAQIGPLDVEVSGGRVTAAPRVYLNSDPPVLVLEQGRVADGVELSPELCNRWFKYVAPVLADTARAKGRFSVDLEDVTVPLTAPEQGNLHGRLVMHEAEVGPGPLSKQVLALGEQVKAIIEKRLPRSEDEPEEQVWLRVPEQEVSFQMAQGRVHHRDLRIYAGDMLVSTSGSVGLDQSLDLIVEATIPDQWLRRNPFMRSLRGQTSLKIPVQGSMSSPRLDQQALRSFAAKTFDAAAGSVIERELNRGLENLFGPRE